MLFIISEVSHVNVCVISDNKYKKVVFTFAADVLVEIIYYESTCVW